MDGRVKPGQGGHEAAGYPSEQTPRHICVPVFIREGEGFA